MNLFRSLAVFLLALMAYPALAQGTMERVPDRPADVGGGPYAKLVISGAMVIDGTGAPPIGPLDIVVERNRIAQMLPTTANAQGRAGADRVIDATGMYVIPGMIDMHGHNGDPAKAPQSDYTYRLWLAHGVTTVRGVSFY